MSQNESQGMSGSNGAQAGTPAPTKGSKASSKQPNRPGPSSGQVVPHAREQRSSDNDLNAVVGLLSGQEHGSEGGDDSPSPYPPADDGKAGRSSHEVAPSAVEDRPALEFDDDEDGGEARKSSKKKPAQSLADYAAAHELDAKELYELAIDVGIEGQEPMTLGALKDHFKQTREFQAAKDDFEDYRSTQLNELAVARQQNDDVMRAIEAEVGPEQFGRLFQTYAEDMADRLKHERAKLLEIFPQWSDADTRRRDREKIEQVLGSYAVRKHEVAQIKDHRVIKFVMDAIRLMEWRDRVRNGKPEKLPSREDPSKKRFRPNRDQRAKDMAASGDKVGAVATLLGGN